MSRDRARNADRFIDQRRRRLDEQRVHTEPLDPTRDEQDQALVHYVRNEVVTTRGDANTVERLLTEIGRSRGQRRDLRSPEPGETEADLPVIFEVPEDSRELVRQVKRRRRDQGQPDIIVGPHHVLTIGPRTHIGPGSDPWPAGEPDRSSPGPAIQGQSPPAVIGVIDTGQWLPAPATLPIQNPVDALDEDPVDTQAPGGVVDYPGGGHGGFIAGIIGHNASGTPVRSRRGSEPGEQDLITEESLVAAVDDAVENHGVRIINLSLGTYEGGPEPGDIPLLRSGVRRWVGRGCLVVCAAGNDETTHPWFPAGFAADPKLKKGVMAVGALETRVGDGPGILAAAAPFSNRGEWVTAWAPGVDVVSEYPQGLRFPYDDNDLSAPFDAGLAHWDGTSFAAPFVAAEVARYAADHGYGNDVQRAWRHLRGDSSSVIFWPSWDKRLNTFDPDHPLNGRITPPPRGSR